MGIGGIIIKSYADIDYSMLQITKKEIDLITNFVKKNKSITYGQATELLDVSSVHRKLHYLVYKKVFKKIIEGNRVRFEYL
jgi:predicted HTH transcriptional regulator